jgi:penicillin-binding protein 1A
VAFIALAVGAGVQTYRVYSSGLPSFDQLHNIEPSIKTKVYDRNGILLKEFYSENRALTPKSAMPDTLIEMLLATEDRRFYDHWGINLRRLVIVAVNNILKMEIEAGASTVTQQLSRMLFLNREQTFERKIKEALTAIKLERTYSKDEILEMYLNQYYFSRGAYGIAAAAHTFFNKEPSQLSINDCAIIIGMLKGPNINSPLNNPDKSLKARDRVLHSYYTFGRLTREEYDSLTTAPLEISPPSEVTGLAPYFTEWVRLHILETYGEDVLYSGGLKVFTTLDAGLQDEAEKALKKRINVLQEMIENRYDIGNNSYTYHLPDTVDEYGDRIRAYKQIEGALVSIDNENGDIIALVGGGDWSENKFNYAVQGLRPPGSAFKPFVYTAAIDNGFRPTEIIDDNPIVLDIPGAKQWRPHNYDNKFMGPITLRDGIRMSRNLVAVRLMLKINPEEPIYYARRMGITTPLEPVPSLALGVSEVHPVELVSAYTTFANKGIHIPYRFIYKIVDRYGRVLEDNSAINKEEVLSEQTAFIMVDLMKSVVDNGTGRGARRLGFSRPAGGKTGTSQSFCDNWFMGYTPQITTGVWLGFGRDRTSMGRNQDGGRNAVPVWTEYMLAAHDSLQIMDFEEPEGIVHLDVCLESGELATDRCVNVRNEVFTIDNQPTTTCHIHPSSGLYTPRRRSADPVPSDTTDDRVHF